MMLDTINMLNAVIWLKAFSSVLTGLEPFLFTWRVRINMAESCVQR